MKKKKQKELEITRLSMQCGDKNQKLQNMINENKTLKQELEIAENNRKQISDQQKIISDLNEKISSIENAYELEKSERKILGDQIQKANEERKKNENQKLELQDQLNLIQNENIGLNLKIDQIENLNEDLKNENQVLKINLDSYKEKYEKINTYKEKIENEIQDIINVEDISTMGFDQELKELLKIYNGFKGNIEEKENIITKNQSKIKELEEKLEVQQQEDIQFKQKFGKEKLKYDSEISNYIKNIDNLKKEIKSKNIKLLEKSKEMEEQIIQNKNLNEKIKDWKFQLEISNLRYEDLHKKLTFENSEKIQLMEKLESYTMDEKKKDIIINNLNLDVERLNNKLLDTKNNQMKIQQENQHLSENIKYLKSKIIERSEKYKEMKTKLEVKTKEVEQYLNQICEYEKSHLETSKKLNDLEKLKQLHEKDIEELQLKNRQLSDTQKIAEEATLIASCKENEKNTLLESYNENKKQHEEIIKDYEKRIAQKEKETSREVKALRNEINTLKENNILDKNNLTKEYEFKIKRLNSEINSLQNENENDVYSNELQ